MEDTMSDEEQDPEVERSKLIDEMKRAVTKKFQTIKSPEDFANMVRDRERGLIAAFNKGKEVRPNNTDDAHIALEEMRTSGFCRRGTPEK
jgi:hypothetical protein